MYLLTLLSPLLIASSALCVPHPGPHNADALEATSWYGTGLGQVSRRSIAMAFDETAEVTMPSPIKARAPQSTGTHLKARAPLSTGSRIFARRPQGTGTHFQPRRPQGTGSFEPLRPQATASQLKYRALE